MGVGGTRFTNKLGDSYFLKEISDAFDVCILYIRPPTTMFSFCPPSHRVPRFFLGSIFMLLFVFGLVRLKAEKLTIELRIVELETEDKQKTTLEEIYPRRPRFVL